MDPVELSARLTLRALPGLRDQAIRRLIREHGSAAAALYAPTHIVELGAKTLPDDAVRARVDYAMRIIQQLGVTVLCADQAGYPERLRVRMGSARPAMLFALGDIRLFEDIGVAIVGSRLMSDYGRNVTEEFSRGLANAGLVVISGLARGIDAVAHKSALDAGGDTIAVVGNGIDVTYPPGNAMLRHRIINEGLLVSQFFPGDRPAKYNFPERNAVLAALSDGVLVVEAGRRSGATITINQAGNFGIDTMAIPGPVGRESSMGTNQLIREGVPCVTTVAEALDEMHRDGRDAALAAQLDRRCTRRALLANALPATTTVPQPTATAASLYSPSAMKIRYALADGILDLDAIAAATHIAIPELVASLVELELAGAVRQQPGARYEISPAGNRDSDPG